jgi:hypothetical protein
VEGSGRLVWRHSRYGGKEERTAQVSSERQAREERRNVRGGLHGSLHSCDLKRSGLGSRESESAQEAG